MTLKLLFAEDWMPEKPCARSSSSLPPGRLPCARPAVRPAYQGPGSASAVLDTSMEISIRIFIRLMGSSFRQSLVLDYVHVAVGACSTRGRRPRDIAVRDGDDV